GSLASALVHPSQIAESQFDTEIRQAGAKASKPPGRARWGVLRLTPTSVTMMFPTYLRIIYGLLFVIALSGQTIAQSQDIIQQLEEARRVYVPLEDFDLVFERDKDGVLLTRDKFNQLLAQAKSNAEKNPAPTGVPVLITSADYAAQIVGDQLLISVTAELTQF